VADQRRSLVDPAAIADSVRRAIPNENQITQKLDITHSGAYTDDKPPRLSHAYPQMTETTPALLRTDSVHIPGKLQRDRSACRAGFAEIGHEP
jgi:hypothetical protein